MSVIKKILPLVLAVGLLFGSCLSVSATETSILTECITILQNKGKVVYARNFVYKLDDLHYMLVTSDKEGEIVLGSGGVFRCDSSYSAYSIAMDFTYISDYSSSVGGNMNLVTSSAGSYYHASSNTILSRMVESDYDLLDSNGEIFFRGPVTLVELAEVLPGGIQNQIAVIMPIAVFCLALVVGLIVLRKKLPQFLPS